MTEYDRLRAEGQALCMTMCFTFTNDVMFFGTLFFFFCWVVLVTIGALAPIPAVIVGTWSLSMMVNLTFSVRDEDVSIPLFVGRWVHPMVFATMADCSAFVYYLLTPWLTVKGYLETRYPIEGAEMARRTAFVAREKVT
jgi:hypothetical protein